MWRLYDDKILTEIFRVGLLIQGLNTDNRLINKMSILGILFKERVKMKSTSSSPLTSHYCVSMGGLRVKISGRGFRRKDWKSVGGCVKAANGW